MRPKLLQDGYIALRGRQRLLLLLLLLALLLGGARGIVTPDAPAERLPSAEADADAPARDSDAAAEPAQDEAPPGDAQAADGPPRISEPDEPSADAELADEDVDPLLDVPSGLFEVVDADSVDNRKRQNYASLDAGATILDAAPDTKSPTNLLVPDKDRYMLTPCSNPRKWVVISLSEDVRRPPQLGRTGARTDSRAAALVLLVFGRTFTQVISQLEKSIDAEVEALDAQAAISTPQLSALPNSAEVSVPRIPDPAELMSQCLMEKNNTVVAIFYDEPQRDNHYRRHGLCCLVDYTNEKIEAEAAADSNANDHSAPVAESLEPDVVDGATPSPGSLPSGASSSNASALTNVSNPNATAPSSTTASASLLPASHNIAASSPQGLGRLESIFVRITKKSKCGHESVRDRLKLDLLIMTYGVCVFFFFAVQALEVNQSVTGRQLEEFHTHQWAAIKMLQVKLSRES
ncbi:unnamed protein product [Phytophthora lilii]|uniref:Unnamed protein product n=1 Tax=Phytophthora lilii TaxID=2077276 RepID=A0A9W6TEC7_9STRA|nr:unnamed protein product [Phytophthora lilii]